MQDNPRDYIQKICSHQKHFDRTPAYDRHRAVNVGHIGYHNKSNQWSLSICVTREKNKCTQIVQHKCHRAVDISVTSLYENALNCAEMKSIRSRHLIVSAAVTFPVNCASSIRTNSIFSSVSMEITLWLREATQSIAKIDSATQAEARFHTGHCRQETG